MWRLQRNHVWLDLEPGNFPLAHCASSNFTWFTVVFFISQIIKDRIDGYMSRTKVMWNSLPGSTALLPEFSDSLQSFPFFYPQLGIVPSEKFTAVIYATTPVMFSSSPLFRLIRTIATSAYTHKVISIIHRLRAMSLLRSSVVWVVCGTYCKSACQVRVQTQSEAIRCFLEQKP